MNASFRPRLCRALLLLLALPFTAATPSAHAQNGSPQSPYVITTAPYTITQSGYYILGNNLNYNPGNNNIATIISVNASNVTLDFNNFYIAGPVGNASQQVYGIKAYERSNLTVKNGTIAYCIFGISINGNGSSTTNNVGHRIDTMRVTYCTHLGINVENSPSSLITNCQISKVTGTTVFSDSFGIYCTGDGATVADCSIGDITALSGTSDGMTLAFGAFAVRNRISNADYGIQAASAKYQNNLALNCTTPFSGGTDAGGNN